MSGLSVHYDCLTVVQSTIEGLSLTSLNATDGVRVGMLPRVSDKIDRLPCVLVTLADAEQQLGTLNSLDDIGYPIGVWIIAASNDDWLSNLERYLTWRQSIFRRFRNQVVSGLPASIVNTLTEPAPIVDEATLNKGYYYSGVVFTFVSREARG